MTKTVKTSKTAKATVVTAPKAKAKKTAKATPAPVAAIAEPTSKRITPGATISEYRVVPSQRKGMPGYFLQGGNYQMNSHNGRNSFICATELYFEDRGAAQAALNQKRQAVAA